MHILKWLLFLPFVLFPPGIAQTEPVELSFVNWIGAEEATADALAAMIAEFETQHPTITVTPINLPFDQTRDQLFTMALGGNPPDVGMIHTLWTGPMAEAGVLAPLNDLLPDIDDWYESTLEGKRFGDDLLFVTWAPSPIMLYYNIELLERAGHDGPPQTWEEMTQMAYDVAALGDNIYGIDIASVQTGGTGFYFLGTFIWNHGGDLLDDAGNVALGSPETVEAFGYAKRLFDDGVSPTGLEIRDFRNLFAQGQLGFHFDGEFGVSIVEGLNPEMSFGSDFGVIPVPGRSTQAPGDTFFVEHNLAVFESSPYKEEAQGLRI